VGRAPGGSGGNGGGPGGCRRTTLEIRIGGIWHDLEERENGPPGDPGHSSGASPVNPPFCWRSADVVEQSPGVLVPSASILEDGIWSTVNFRIKSG